MDEVRQAHLPGNYELYDPASSEPGSALCKLCWEEAGERNAASLVTAWLSMEGWDAMWWLCRNHQEGVKSGSTKSRLFLRSVSGVVRYPALHAT